MCVCIIFGDINKYDYKLLDNQEQYNPSGVEKKIFKWTLMGFLNIEALLKLVCLIPGDC